MWQNLRIFAFFKKVLIFSQKIPQRMQNKKDMPDMFLRELTYAEACSLLSMRAIYSVMDLQVRCFKRGRGELHVMASTCCKLLQ